MAPRKNAYETALKVAADAGIVQPPPFAIPVTVEIHMWPTNEVMQDGDVPEHYWRPTPRQVAAAIQKALGHKDLDEGWTIGVVTGGV